MADALKSVEVAVVQAAPVLFDREATIDKACRLIAEAQAKGARIILLPEAFVPAYPRGLGFGMVVGQRSEAGRRLWERYRDNAVDVPSPATERLGEAARAAGAYVAIGVIERDAVSGGTLYCTLLYFGPDGTLLGKHRKLKPTGSERLIWGEGDGSTLFATATPFGTIGGLICWENYMPLARMAMYGKGVSLYLAPTADQRDTWQATIRHIACEGRCFVLAAISSSHDRCTRRTSRRARISRTSRRSCAGEAAPSSLPSARSSPAPCSTGRDCSPPSWTSARWPGAAWTSTWWVTTRGPTCSVSR